MSESADISLWPLVAYFALTIVLVSAILLVSHFVGERRRDRRNHPYESGMSPTGTTHIHISVTYYLIAMFFLIFDLAATFIFAWSVSLRETGWHGYLVMLVFIFILGIGFAYLWREGVLEAGFRRQAAGKTKKKQGAPVSSSPKVQRFPAASLPHPIIDSRNRPMNNKNPEPGSHSFLLSRLQDLLSWGRKNSLWPFNFGLSCAMWKWRRLLTSRYDIARFGSEVVGRKPAGSRCDDRRRNRFYQGSAGDQPALPSRCGNRDG